MKSKRRAVRARSSVSKRVILIIAALSAAPIAAAAMGIDFGLAAPAGAAASGAALHSLLEWTSVCLAACIALLAFAHFSIRRDAATPIIGMAFLCAGFIDAFHTLAADGLIATVADPAELLPATWALGRMFQAGILGAGVCLLLVLGRDKRRTGLGFVLGTSLAFGGVAYIVVHTYATARSLPRIVRPDWIVTRPWDLVPLLLLVLLVLPACIRFHRREPSVFSLALLASLLPQIASQLHMTFGSSVLFDADFNIAHFLKILAFAVPLCGLTADYVGAYRRKDRALRDLEAARAELDGHSQDLEAANLRLNLQARELLEARRKAEGANAAKSEFLASMSHEIRTPMTVILGLAEELREQGGERDEALGRIETILEEGHHLMTILEDILDLSRIEAGMLEIERVPCVPSALVAEVAKIMEPRIAAKGLRFEVQSHGLIPEKVVVDPIRLREILVNLLASAVEYTDEGSVRLEYRAVAPEAGIGDAVSEPSLRFDVIDSGVGVSRDEIEVAFEPFARESKPADRVRRGTGLGLAICRRLVSMLGGDFLVTSEPGRGTRFRVRVPVGSLDEVIVSEGASRRESPAPPGPARGSEPLGCRLLVVEDNRAILRLMTRMLTVAGAEVTGAERGDEAVSLISSTEGTGAAFDVILMDMQLPGLDGCTATKLLRESGYCGVIVAVTASVMPADRQRLLEAGCDDVVLKPIERERLLATIRSRLEHAGASNPGLALLPG